MSAQGILKAKYEWEGLAWQTPFADVLKGRIKNYAVPLLIYRYRPGLVRDNVKELVREAERLLPYKNPGLLPLMDFHFDGDHFFMIYRVDPDMVLLDHYLQHPLETEEAVALIEQLLVTLVQLEQNGFCGVNFSTQNMWMTPDGKLKLTEVHLPKVVVSSTAASALGDWPFFAPESIASRRYSASSDVFGFGAFCYFLLCQQWPYPTENSDDPHHRFLHQPADCRTLNPEIPYKLALVLERCLRIDPKDRFGSFEELTYAYNSPTLSIPTFLDEEDDDMAKKAPRKSLGQQLKQFTPVLLIVALLAGGYALYLSYMNSIPTQTVPNVVGLPLQTATELLTDYKLNGVELARRPDPHIPSGSVIEAIPAVGREIKEGRTVQLILSIGPEHMLMPDLVNRHLERAMLLLSELGISPNVVYVSDGGKAEMVLEQSPPANAEVRGNTPVTLTVSQGLPISVNFSKPMAGATEVSAKLSIGCFPDQDGPFVILRYTLGGQTQTLMSQHLGSGESIPFETTLEPGGQLSITFDGKVVWKKDVPKL
ncbi:MAG: PASTA domain-containing protein [Candidatus Margulisiibacteriota bacterium]